MALWLSVRIRCQLPLPQRPSLSPGRGQPHHCTLQELWGPPGEEDCAPAGPPVRTFMLWYLSESRTLSTSSHTPCSSSSCSRHTL